MVRGYLVKTHLNFRFNTFCKTVAHSPRRAGARKQTSGLAETGHRPFRKILQGRHERAQKPDTASYRTSTEFFVRPLRDEVRPVDTDPNVLVMPADGVISQLGNIEDDKILQAKGHNYSLGSAAGR